MINPLMELFITLCIIANTMLMALEKLSLSSEQVTKGNNVSEFNFLLKCMPANNDVFWENVPF